MAEVAVEVEAVAVGKRVAVPLRTRLSFSLSLWTFPTVVPGCGATWWREPSAKGGAQGKLAANSGDGWWGESAG